MWSLDDPKHREAVDRSAMLAEIDRLPDQLVEAWTWGQAWPLPMTTLPRAVVVAGMGGSAIAADLLQGYVQNVVPVPYVVWRDYGLPAWAQGPEVLVVASSHSGNTEETLSAARTAWARGCTWMAITTGGQLAVLAEDRGATLWRFEHAGQPRAAVGYSFGLLLALFARLGLIPDPRSDLERAIEAMRQQQASLRFDVPTPLNPAKRLAGQWVDRWVTVFGSGFLAPVARRWKGQINELAKAWAEFEVLPEADHNTLAGLLKPPALFREHMALFLDAEALPARHRARVRLTQQVFMQAGLNTDRFLAPGEGALAQQWTALHFGDYAAYYLALAYGVDPTPVESIQTFKALLAQEPDETDAS
ncbi:MAG: bifunctional phosphoglucose/phosphomannose isomerase [Chloroflexi bacterium]|nr:bifunctional phosphoglucose/phosphomannose isomerase [Chloroflexota bacterium]